MTFEQAQTQLRVVVPIEEEEEEVINMDESVFKGR
jgi:hypothetical protein